jgi:hypothetical protein
MKIVIFIQLGSLQNLLRIQMDHHHIHHHHLMDRFIIIQLDIYIY